MMPSWVPFWPIMTLPYLGLLLVGWLLPVSLQSVVRFRDCLISAVVGYLLVAPWWLLSPTMLPRPAFAEGWWNATYSVMTAIDLPHNIRPCGHAVLPCVATWYVAQEYPRWRTWLWVMLALGLPTIAMTWQHRPVDIIMGLGAAGLGILVARMKRDE